MTDAEYGKHIREQSKLYARRASARQRIFMRKIREAGITVTDKEIDEEMKKFKK